jgi:tetrahydromethanopterin S-methyltransferase subunit F
MNAEKIIGNVCGVLFTIGLVVLLLVLLVLPTLLEVVTL